MALKIENDRVVRLTYRILDGNGRVIEETTPAQPYEYLHGRGQINAPVERELAGKTAGFTREVVVSPRDAYGQYHPSLVAEIPRAGFPKGTVVEVGMKFNTKDPNGRAITVRVIEAGDEMVTVDGNHPLAGLDLIFDIRVLHVREARPEEIEAGKVNASALDPNMDVPMEGDEEFGPGGGGSGGSIH